jgi:protein involved in sex pheromone biosynthesis
MSKTYLIVDAGQADIHRPDYVDWMLEQDYRANHNPNLIEIPHDKIEIAVNDGMSYLTTVNGDKYYYKKSSVSGKWESVATAILVLLVLFAVSGGCGMLR